MFTISPALIQQCIDMVAKEQDYIPFPDGIEADYSVYNIPCEGVWIVEPWATEGGDYIKIQEIVLSAPKRARWSMAGLWYTKRSEKDCRHGMTPTVICWTVY